MSQEFALVVTQAFGDYDRGARITDPEEIAAVYAAGHEGSVVKTAIDPLDHDKNGVKGGSVKSKPSSAVDPS